MLTEVMESLRAPLRPVYLLESLCGVFSAAEPMTQSFHFTFYLSSAHVCRSLLSLTLHIHPLFSAFLRFIKYLLFSGSVCLFSGVWVQHWSVAQQCRLRRNSVWLSDRGRRLGLAWVSECAGNTDCSPTAGQTGPTSCTHCSHSLSQHTG